MTYPALPDTYCIVMRVFFLRGEYVWGDLSDGPVTFDNAVDRIIDSFDDAVWMDPTAETVRVFEIDGRVVLDRTEDALAKVLDQ